jgi:hypothetical protein
MREFLLGSALALATGTLALGQTLAPPSPPPTPSATPQGSVNPPRSIGLKTGMAVTDKNGARVGTVAQIGHTAEGAPAVLLDVDGKKIGVPESILTVDPAGDHAVASVTKAQIVTAGAGPQAKPGAHAPPG